jgi:hypothetical protein
MQHIEKTDTYKARLKNYRIGLQSKGNYKKRASRGKKYKIREKVFKNTQKNVGYQQNYILMDRSEFDQHDLNTEATIINPSMKLEEKSMNNVSFGETCIKLVEEIQKFSQPTIPNFLKPATSNFNEYYQYVDPNKFNRKRVPLLVQKFRLDRLSEVISLIKQRKRKDFFFAFEDTAIRIKQEMELKKLQDAEK